MSDIQDQQQDAEMMDPVVKAILMIDERLQALEKVVMDDLIGGVTNLYKKNQRSLGIEDLKGKYGSMFDPFKDFYSEAYPGAPDIMEKVYDMLEGLKGEEGFNDELADGKIKELASQFQAKLDKIRGIKAPEPAATEIEIEVSKEAPDELDTLAKEMEARKAKIRR